LPILILLLLGTAGVASRDAASRLAVWSGVAVLFTEGILLARRDGRGITGYLLAASIYAALRIVDSASAFP
jgi:hypothetical protein